MGVLAQGISTRPSAEINDKFYTPLGIAESMVAMVDFREGDRVLEPCVGGGAIFDLLPDTCERLWCEIDKGVDFFDFTDPVDVLITNPPFSKFKRFLKHCVTLRPRVICLLFGILNVTLPRMNMLREAGYTLTKQHHSFWNAVMGSRVDILLFELDVEGMPDVMTTYDYTSHKTQKV